MTTEKTLSSAMRALRGPRLIRGEEMAEYQRAATGCFLPTTQSPDGRYMNENTERMLGIWTAAIEWACKQLDPLVAEGSAQPSQAAASEWISIDERLPELHQTVALLDENRWMNTGSDEHSVNWHGGGYLCEFGHKYWSIFGEMRSQCLDAVTHWMPLPVAPELRTTPATPASATNGEKGGA